MLEFQFLLSKFCVVLSFHFLFFGGTCLKEREEQKRKEKLERKERLLDINKARPPSSHNAGTSSLRGDDYNPLMGSGGSCGWRPTKKRCGRGGCG